MLFRHSFWLYLLTFVIVFGYIVAMVNDMIKSQGIEKTLEIVCALEDISQAGMARTMSQAPQGFNKKIKNESMRYNEAEEIADKFGYDIVWMKRKD